MATCRFILENLLAGASVLNGTAGSPTPPARSEVAPFVMERALNSDRRSLWQANAPNATAGFPFFGSGYQIELDAGANVTLDTFAFHGLSCPGGTINLIHVGTHPAYPSALYNTMADTSDYGPIVRDACITTSVPQTARYWWIWFDSSAAPVVGRIVGGLKVDLGVAPNPGAETTTFQNRIEQSMQDGSVNVNSLGYPGKRFTWNFDPILVGTRNLIRSVAAAPASVSYIDPDNICHEALISGGSVKVVRHYDGLYGASMEGIGLP